MANNPGSGNNMDKLPLSESVEVVNVPQPVFDKSQALVDMANNTFKELCRTLENEQTKLLELEERRKKLQEEMQRLKMEIEEEKHTYRLHLVETMPSGMDTLQASSATSFDNEEFTEGETDATDPESSDEYKQRQQLDLQKKLDTCYEVDENNDEDMTLAVDGNKGNDETGLLLYGVPSSEESQMGSTTRDQSQSDEQFTDPDDDL